MEVLRKKMEVNKSQKIARMFVCECCHYNTSNKYDYEKHAMTSKHKNNQNGSILEVNKSQKSQKIATAFICDCKKSFNTHSGLWKHMKKCVPINTVTTENTTELVTYLMKENAEFKNMLLDVCKKDNVAVNNVQTINTNCNNKSFNLNVFLNETCKDAMNMKDFVDSIQITLADIENMGKLGFVNGITNIIVNRLKAIDVHMRPVHCTDQRRETMYVKEKNQWNKEEEDNKNIRTFIQLVAHKNTRNLSLFKNKHPDCLEYHSKYNDQYNKIVMETFGGYGNTDYDSENKIIRKLVKELSIYKSG